MPDGIVWSSEPKTLTIPFEYRPLTESEKTRYGNKNQQDKIIEEALKAIPERLKGNAEALAALSAERHKDAKGNPVSYLAHHLRQYTARNTRDFFIHKDLKGFLSRELDFYLKNEVLNLDELEAAGEDLAEGWFQLMRLIKRIGNHIIDFLAQIEDFQKALWEKKKFVTETFYCITVGNIPEEFYPEIAENEAQWEEWQKLFGIEPPPLAHQGEDRGMTSPSTSTQEIGSREETPNPSPLWGEGRGEGRKSRTKEERSELLMQLAREMRKAPTDAEQRLWYFLRNRRLGGYKFRRQHSIGPYIVDFVCIEKGVIVEVDGGQHAEDLQRRKDVERTRFLENRGFRVIRFWNHEVLKNTEEVLAAILDALDAPHPGPLPEGERGIEECANGIPEGERGIEKRANALLEGEREKIEERIAFLMAHPTLVLDTRHFPQDFTDRLLAAFDNLDEMTDGLLIHSENWQALNLLLEKYRERVKVIYIDPPYNTSNDGFLYRDNYWHSSWLAMMYDRLALGREWMREDGAIFISIDDNEIHHLRNVLDGFGDRIGTFVWEKKKKGSHLSHTFRDLTEYVLSYTPNISRIGELYGEEAYSNKWQPLIKRHNVERELRFPAGKIKSELKDGKYTPAIYGQGETAIHLLDPIIVKDGVIVNRFRMRARFVWTQETLNREINLGSQIKLSKNMRPNVLRADQEEKTKRPPSLITKDIAAYEDAFAELKNIFGDVIYAYPKPTGLVNFIVKALTYFKPQGIILDYFAGSGTTGHAVINLNREDGGRRKFILVEMGEYFDTVLLPRIKKVTFAPEWKNGRPPPPTPSPQGGGGKNPTPTPPPPGTGREPP
ncbi:MAG: DUF559 domain-containing protein, partial [Candidatus Hydrothermae bacterium]|nr:DUF559 domain-containing protein [Candidatus Hydrothermae bacterium]